MTRDRESFLLDVYDSARFLLDFTRNENFQKYQQDRPFRRVIERELEIIGEALFQLNKIDPQLLAKISEHERIIGFRHVIVHGYFNLKPDLVWTVVKSKLGVLIEEVGGLLTAAGFPPNDKGNQP